MKLRQTTLKLITGMLLCVSVNHGSAQQSRVDSVIQILAASKQQAGLDTASFQIAADLLGTAEITDTQITLLETTFSKAFDHGSNQDLNYYLKLSILNAISNVDYKRAIEYGKQNIENLKKNKTPNADRFRSDFLTSLRLPYRNSGRISEGFQYFNNKLTAYKEVNDSSGLLACYYVLAGFYNATGLIEQAIYNIKKSLSYSDTVTDDRRLFFGFEDIRGKRFWLNNLNVLGTFYLENGDPVEALQYVAIAKNGAQAMGYNELYGVIYRNFAQAGIMMNHLDSVQYFLDEAKEIAINKNRYSALVTMLQLEVLYKIKTGEFEQGEELLNKCWKLIEEYKIPVSPYPGTIDPDYYLALIRIEQGRDRDAILLINKDTKRLLNLRNDLLRDYKLLAGLLERTGSYQEAAKVYSTYTALQDSVLADQKKYQSGSFEIEQQLNERELSITKLRSDNEVAALIKNFTIGLSILLLLLAAMIYYRFRSKQKANNILQKALSELRATQAQLIQSEKMASLGELTAGIAHEIQNPLNFVNNFSEVNKELIEELKSQKSKVKSERDEELESEILNDIKENEQKINHHGKRADAIVKGMLQHSRASIGKKEPTDINTIADEYLRLSYHGFRAKDKLFDAIPINIGIETHFDESIGKIEVIPQDIGRVLLNLFNNAFYAVAEKKKQFADGYEPTVSISTKKEGDKVIISVRDNGIGISKKVVDKIFQPFFTTKPTGQGTGLGLSLSYEIIKAHGGELKVETNEGDYSCFIIELST